MRHHLAKFVPGALAPTALLLLAFSNEAMGACPGVTFPCGLRTFVEARVGEPSGFPTGTAQTFDDGGPHQVNESRSGFVGNDPALGWSGDASASASATFGTLNVAGSISTAGTAVGGGASANSSSMAEFDDTLSLFGPLPSPLLRVSWAVDITSRLPSILAGGTAGWDLQMLVGTARGNNGIHVGETVDNTGSTVHGGNPVRVTGVATVQFGLTLFHFVLSGHTEGSGPGVNSFYDVSATWAGITALTTDDGVPVPIRFTSLSGTDWQLSQVAAVPEPSNYAMMVAGLGLVGFIVRRRKRFS